MRPFLARSESLRAKLICTVYPLLTFLSSAPPQIEPGQHCVGCGWDGETKTIVALAVIVIAGGLSVTVLPAKYVVVGRRYEYVVVWYDVWCTVTVVGVLAGRGS